MQVYTGRELFMVRLNHRHIVDCCTFTIHALHGFTNIRLAGSTLKATCSIPMTSCSCGSFIQKYSFTNQKKRHLCAPAAAEGCCTRGL